MRRGAARAVLGACAMLMVVGCIEDTPELDDLELSTSEARGGDTVTGTAKVADDNGDLDGGKVRITLRSADAGGRVIATQDLPIAFEDRTRHASLSFFIRLPAATTRGSALLEVVIIDKAGHASAPQSAPLLVR